MLATPDTDFDARGRMSVIYESFKTERDHEGIDYLVCQAMTCQRWRLGTLNGLGPNAVLIARNAGAVAHLEDYFGGRHGDDLRPRGRQ